MSISVCEYQRDCTPTFSTVLAFNEALFYVASVEMENRPWLLCAAVKERRSFEEAKLADVRRWSVFRREIFCSQSTLNSPEWQSEGEWTEQTKIYNWTLCCDAQLWAGGASVSFNDLCFVRLDPSFLSTEEMIIQWDRTGATMSEPSRPCRDLKSFILVRGGLTW